MPKHMVKGSDKRFAKELSQKKKKKKKRTVTQITDSFLMPTVLILLADSTRANAGFLLHR